MATLNHLFCLPFVMDLLRPCNKSVADKRVKNNESSKNLSATDRDKGILKPSIFGNISENSSGKWKWNARFNSNKSLFCHWRLTCLTDFNV
jgi:hypothetical protein